MFIKNKKEKPVEENKMACTTSCTTECHFNVGRYKVKIQDGDITGANISDSSSFSSSSFSLYSSYIFFKDKEELKHVCKEILSKLGEYEVTHGR